MTQGTRGLNSNCVVFLKKTCCSHSVGRLYVAENMKSNFYKTLANLFFIYKNYAFPKLSVFTMLQYTGYIQCDLCIADRKQKETEIS